MTEQEKFKITDPNYFDLVYKYGGDKESLNQFSAYSPHFISDYLAALYLPASQVSPRLVRSFGYPSIPKCYSLCSKESLSASGVEKLRRIPSINLRGQGVIVGIVDTGIDYTNPVFLREDGSSKILAIWDQSIDSADRFPYALYPTFYGTEYSMEQINLALKSENPLQVVPSVDEIGHGTKLAGIAAGSEDRNNDFSGVAPAADLLIVKLKPAKKLLKDFFFIPDNVPCYQENDLIWAIKYLVYKASDLKRPLALCLGVGTSQGAHDDSGFLNTVASIHADTPGVAMTLPAGNEGNMGRHFFSQIDTQTSPVSVEMIVGENVAGFSLELWGEPPTIYTLDMISPSGERIQSLAGTLEENRRITFTFEQTIIYADYVMIEQETGKQLILLRFQKPSAGIWRFLVSARGDLKGEFHLWLPSDGFIPTDTHFISPNQYTTITSPGNCIIPITVTAYDPVTNALYTASGKGFSTSNIINPDLSAPGVNLQCPGPNHEFTTMTGTGAAAAHTTGIAAMLLEWCIVDNNYPGIDSVGIKKFLMRGAGRSNNLIYPNRDWGYGTIDVYNTFNILRTDL